MDHTFSGGPSIAESTVPRPANWRSIAGQAVTQYHAIQDAGELGVALAVAANHGPATVLEVGSFAGGTAWAWDQIPTVKKIIAIDYQPEPDAPALMSSFRADMHLIQLDSGTPAALAQVKAILGTTAVDLLFIDGSHDYESVARDWHTYHQLVKPGGLVMFHDTQPHYGRPEVQVHRLWRDLQSAYSTTEIVGCPGQWAGIGIVWK